jgi:hypothetical protein
VSQSNPTTFFGVQYNLIIILVKRTPIKVYSRASVLLDKRGLNFDCSYQPDLRLARGESENIKIIVASCTILHRFIPWAFSRVWYSYGLLT